MLNSFTNRLGHGPFRGPSTQKYSLIEYSCGDSCSLGYDVKALAVYGFAARSVLRLVATRNPSTVTWFVVSGKIISLNGQVIPVSVSQSPRFESSEVIPLGTNSNSLRAIPCIAIVSVISTTRPHSCPRSVQPCVGRLVRGSTGRNHLIAPTPARRRRATSKVAAVNYLNDSALAPAKNVRPFKALNYRPAPMNGPNGSFHSGSVCKIYLHRQGAA